MASGECLKRLEPQSSTHDVCRLMLSRVDADGLASARVRTQDGEQSSGRWRWKDPTTRPSARRLPMDLEAARAGHSNGLTGPHLRPAHRPTAFAAKDVQNCAGQKW